jgi:hypothetical protein
MLKIKLLIMWLVLVSASPFAQKLSQNEINSLNYTIYQSLAKENSLVMKRKTSQGEVSSCDFEYTYAYRDFNAKQGATVMVQGAFGFLYAKGKLPSYFLKIQPYMSDVTTKDKDKMWILMPLFYLDVFANGKSIKKYQMSEFACENGGVCRVYSDSDGSLAKTVYGPKNFDFEIKFSLSKSGIDNSLVFSDLIPKNKYLVEATNFIECSLEIMNRMEKDLEQLPKGK